ncbi:hypothetical protein [Brevibacillus formosus]|uniref:hypothetical protein n=1 Tax=Brevibacillus formosus TaxID=54913 RepID=UPI003F1CE7E5
MKKALKLAALSSVLSLSLVSGIASAFTSFGAPFPSSFQGGEEYSTKDFEPSYDEITIRAYQKASSGSADVDYRLMEIGTFKDYQVDHANAEGNYTSTTGGAYYANLGNITINDDNPFWYYIIVHNYSSSSVTTTGSVVVYDSTS